MASKEQAYNEGYKRGLDGKGCSTSWTAPVADTLYNEHGSSKARSEGYHAGVRDRAKIDAEKGGGNSSGK